jgi:hypothetical protein
MVLVPATPCRGSGAARHGPHRRRGTVMGTLRLSVVGTDLLALLGGMAAVGSGQNESDTQASDASTLLSVVTPYGRSTGSGTTTVGDGRVSARDYAHVGPFAAGDPRISGELWSIWSTRTLWPPTRV